MFKKLWKTQSICPVCRKTLEAYYVEEDGKVYLRKTCKEHGEFESFIADLKSDFVEWSANKVINIPPKRALTKGSTEDECPLHCGTCEKHLQTACCVLIDVTDRCNQHCPYCFAKAEADLANEPSLEEIERKYDVLLELGEERPFNIQLSGGEPTVREDLPEIIRLGRRKGFDYIQINTNGRKLAADEGYAKLLKSAGATVIYLQFDGTDDEVYKILRGEPLLEIKKQAIENCRKAGLPVTLVPTIVKNINLDQIGSMMEFLLDHVDVVKGIHFQPVSFFGRYPEEQKSDGGKRKDYENRVTMFDIMHAIEIQTDGKMKYEDFCTLTSGHPLCCFYSTYQKQRDGSIRSLISEKTRSEGVSCCDSATPLEIIKRDRDYVLNKWDLPEKNSCCDEKPHSSCCCEKPQTSCCEPGVMDFDRFLQELKSSMFTVSGMAFQDISNLDAERLKRCRVQVLSEDDRLIPFCAYNSIYRK